MKPVSGREEWCERGWEKTAQKSTRLPFPIPSKLDGNRSRHGKRTISLHTPDYLVVGFDRDVVDGRKRACEAWEREFGYQRAQAGHGAGKDSLSKEWGSFAGVV
jgi:hypothetical protein